MPNPIDAMLLAIETDDTVTFCLLINRKGAKLNERGTNGQTPLIATLIHNRFVMFSQLLNAPYRVDVNTTDSDGHSPLWHAVRLDRLVEKLELVRRGGK